MSPRAVPSTSRYWPTLSSTRSSFQMAATSSGAPATKWSAYTWARSPTRIATPSPNRRGSPRQRSIDVAVTEVEVHRARAAPGGRAVHDVVVHERERLQQLERGADVDDGGRCRDRRRRPRSPSGRTRVAGACRSRRRIAAAPATAPRGRGRAPPTVSISVSSSSASRSLHPLGDEHEAGRHRHGTGRDAHRSYVPRRVAAAPARAPATVSGGATRRSEPTRTA